MNAKNNNNIQDDVDLINIFDDNTATVKSAVSKTLPKFNSSPVTTLDNGYKALGIRGADNYVFSNYRQSLIILTSKDFNKANIINIFGKSFLDQKYAYYDEKGNFKGYDMTELQNDVVEACIKEGNYNIENIKGYGIFADPLSKGNLIVNTENIWGTSEDFNSKRIRGKFIFNNEKNLFIEKEQEQVSPGDVKRLVAILSTWKFKRGVQDIRLQLGWILCAGFAGVLKWRTHESLTGKRGTGKSTLQEFIKNLLGQLAILLEGSSSEPGIRQAMGNSSGAVLLDESEADGVRLGQILAMLRAASSGIKKAMGTSDQKGNTFELRMAGLLSGIVPPKLNGADNSRFLKIELEVRDETKRNSDLLDIDFQEKLGKKLTMTMIKNFKLFEELIIKVRMYLLDKGADSRYADTYGALIASSFLILNLIDIPEDPFGDNSIKTYTDEELYTYIEEFDFENEKAQSQFSDEEELLKQIFITEISNDDLRKENILQFILTYNTSSESKGAIKNILGRYGIKTDKEDNNIVVYFDCDDNKLKSLLRNTRFANGDLKAVLNRIEYAEEVKKEISIGNIRRSRKNLIKIILDKNKYNSNDSILDVDVLANKLDIDEDEIPFK